jgi:hypothetical protein
MSNDFSNKDRSRQRQFGYLDYFAEGMTEEEFIEEYVFIRKFYARDIDFSILAFSGVPEEDQTSTNIKEILHDIYISNPRKNAWANTRNLSDKLRTFLTLRGDII